MEYLKIKMIHKDTAWYIEILMWCKDNAIVWTSFFLGWRALDLGFKYLNNGRDAAIRHIVQDELSKGLGIEIKQLSSDVKDLGHAIFELKNKI